MPIAFLPFLKLTPLEGRKDKKGLVSFPVMISTVELEECRETLEGKFRVRWGRGLFIVFD